MLFPHEIPVLKLSRKPRRLIEALHLVAFVASLALFWEYTKWLGNTLGIPLHARLKDQPNGNLWGILFIGTMPLFIYGCRYGCRWALFLVLAAFLRWRERWTTAQIRGLRLHGDLPANWLKSSDSLARSTGDADSLMQILGPETLTIFISTVGLAAAIYADYIIFRHFRLVGLLSPFAIACIFCPMGLGFVMQHSFKRGLNSARIYCLVTSSTGCLLVSTVDYLLNHQS